MTRVLLVTGARSLAARPGAEAWARGLIAEALVGVDLLIVGDAPGPDAWALGDATQRIGCRMMRESHRYVIHGRNAGCIEIDTGHGDVTLMAWTTEREHALLARNAAMVADAARQRADGNDVTVLALLDGTRPAGSTRGTEHTAALAERAGLTVRREVWR